MPSSCGSSWYTPDASSLRHAHLEGAKGVLCLRGLFSLRICYHDKFRLNQIEMYMCIYDTKYVTLHSVYCMEFSHVNLPECKCKWISCLSFGKFVCRCSPLHPPQFYLAWSRLVANATFVTAAYHGVGEVTNGGFDGFGEMDWQYFKCSLIVLGSSQHHTRHIPITWQWLQ